VQCNTVIWHSRYKILQQVHVHEWSLLDTKLTFRLTLFLKQLTKIRSIKICHFYSYFCDTYIKKIQGNHNYCTQYGICNTAIFPRYTCKHIWNEYKFRSMKYAFGKRTTLFSLWCRAPQQMLRTHRSLEASCAIMWWWLVFSSNGAPVEWNWQGKTEVLGEKPVPVPLCPPQFPHGLTRHRTRASAVRGRRLTAWAMTRPTPLLLTHVGKRVKTAW
jgi:hypothetical protein